jgi:GTPase SAR1 family protein
MTDKLCLKKPLLVFGNGTAGKTTVVRKLVSEGVIDAYVELDDFQKYASGLAEPSQLGMDCDWGDAWKEHMRKSIRILGAAVNGITRKDCVAISGLWPGHEKLLLPMLQDYEVFVLVVDNYEEAKRRWAERGNDPQMFTDLWDEDRFYELVKSFESLAQHFNEKGKLVSPDHPVVKHAFPESRQYYAGFAQSELPPETPDPESDPDSEEVA